jgi:hypothetical protein
MREEEQRPEPFSFFRHLPCRIGQTYESSRFYNTTLHPFQAWMVENAIEKA